MQPHPHPHPRVHSALMMQNARVQSSIPLLRNPNIPPVLRGAAGEGERGEEVL